MRYLIVLSISVLFMVSCSTPLESPRKGMDRIVDDAPFSTTVGSRKALMIGISNYQYISKLGDNPINDAEDMRAVFKEKLGFTTMLRLDVKTSSEFKEAVNAFAKTIRPNDEVVVYYSGHGAQGSSDNYLLPASANVAAPGHLETEAMPVRYMLSALEEKQPRVSVIILDACRDNPFKGIFKGEVKDGLAPASAPSGSFIAYAAKEGQKAATGVGQRNSPYVAVLKEELQRPGLSIFDIFTNVRKVVKHNSGTGQEPTFYSALDSSYWFLPPVVTPQPPLVTPQPVTPPKPPVVVRPPEPVLGNSFKECAYCPEMVRIPGGSFMMGSNDGHSDEKPVHEVSVNGFYMSKYEATISDYLACVREGGCKQPEWLESGSSYNIHTGSDDYYKRKGMSENNQTHPMTGISWNDAVAYAQWLSRKTGRNYRLPTEAEWEYAARAGTQSKWHFGDDENQLGNYAWYWYNSDSKTHPVGQKQPNQFGLYDMAGNVWEWTCSDKTSSYDGNETKCSNSSESKSLRGGSWSNDADLCHAANRNFNTPSVRNDDLGFRVILFSR